MKKITKCLLCILLCATLLVPTFAALASTQYIGYEFSDGTTVVNGRTKKVLNTKDTVSIYGSGQRVRIDVMPGKTGFYTISVNHQSLKTNQPTAASQIDINSIRLPKYDEDGEFDFDEDDVEYVDRTITNKPASGNYLTSYSAYFYGLKLKEVSFFVQLPSQSVTSDITVTYHSSHTFRSTPDNEEPATCEEEGERTFFCTVCGYPKREIVPVKPHKWSATQVEPATVDPTDKSSEDGYTYHTCLVCGEEEVISNIVRVNTKISISDKTYTGEAIKPTIKVYDKKNVALKSTDYSVTYSSNKNVGTACAQIKFKGYYSGSMKVYFDILPKKTSIESLTADSKAFTVKWKKQTTQTTGYHIQYCTSSSFPESSRKYAFVSDNTKVSKKFSSLAAKKKYYVRIRTYKTVNGKKYYSGWSEVKSVTTKA